jgi:hypothetical protein
MKVDAFRKHLLDVIGHEAGHRQRMAGGNGTPPALRS